ncbi:hypothetical protein HPP92_023685 [Vanilla planifolia]|uniref:Transcription factor CBF/NF-Y/archaeal histone domain-containing protein n=1 Tax=Vanilla planifolia TaxID=51239 RepID=A0A835UCW8_VANPL|nr:hypothetical protein HPP92_024028 [Vanilla planifolia]KAG0455897.1 hypothetical protein HPP92_023685 [Vanilla planifolia]
MGGASPESSVSSDQCNSVGAGRVRELDQFMPIVGIGRIMRQAVPENGKIAGEAKDFVQECVTEFISFITSEAIDRCQKERRKVINGEDIVLVLESLGFDEYIEPLKLYLKLYREADNKGLRSVYQFDKRDGTANGVDEL